MVCLCIASPLLISRNCPIPLQLFLLTLSPSHPRMECFPTSQISPSFPYEVFYFLSNPASVFVLQTTHPTQNKMVSFRGNNHVTFFLLEDEISLLSFPEAEQQTRSFWTINKWRLSIRMMTNVTWFLEDEASDFGFFVPEEQQHEYFLPKDEQSHFCPSWEYLVREPAQTKTVTCA